MPLSSHPPALRQECARAAELFEALLPLDFAGRTRVLAELRPLLERIDQRVKELDLRHPEFPVEQGWLVDAATALQAIEMDRGGPLVQKFAPRAAADLRRIAAGPPSD